jgi:hypothetical protein
VAEAIMRSGLPRYKSVGIRDARYRRSKLTAII